MGGERRAKGERTWGGGDEGQNKGVAPGKEVGALHPLRSPSKEEGREPPFPFWFIFPSGDAVRSLDQRPEARGRTQGGRGTRSRPRPRRARGGPRSSVLTLEWLEEGRGRTLTHPIDPRDSNPQFFYNPHRKYQ